MLKNQVTEAMTKEEEIDDVDEELSESSTFPIPVSLRQPKLSGFEFFEKVLGSPKYIVAPMVDQSELAWRLLCRRHGAQLCYTPMFHAKCFTQDRRYRKEALQSCPEDRPLLLQFCGNDPQILLQAGLLAQDHCDGIDINLGCPQQIARRGHYGSFLQDEWELLSEIVSTLHKNLSVPVTCKIRVFDDVNRTIKYAQMLERAGAQVLTVHGRTRDMKGPLTGIADWNIIKLVRESVSIPVIANGNICCIRDVERCLAETGVNGVMSAEGNLHNPFFFEGVTPTIWEVGVEYLDLVEKYPPPANSYIRGHLFKMFQHLLVLQSSSAFRIQMAIARNVNDFRRVINMIEEKYKPIHEGLVMWDDYAEHCGGGGDDNVLDYNLKLPPWMCQPYYRKSPEEREREKAMEAEMNESDLKAIKLIAKKKKEYYDREGNVITKKNLRRLKRLERTARIKSERKGFVCEAQRCGNNKGRKCVYAFCGNCCKEKCLREKIACVGHKIIKTDDDEGEGQVEQMLTEG